MKISKQYVYLTGCNGQLGKAIAYCLRESNCVVIGLDLNSQALNPFVHYFFEASVTDAESIKAVFNAPIKGIENALSISLVNNAGILRDKSFKNMEMADWDLVLDVHLNGTAYVTKAAWPIMYEKNYGRIVLTSSVSGIYGNFGQANYGAAKMGMLGLMNVLCIEGLSKNIKVNVLAPAAETRLIATIPGVDVNPDDPSEERHPQLVTPSVLLMCDEDAPTGRVIHAGNGEFYSSAIFSNDHINLGKDVTYEELLEHKEKLLDMSGSVETSGLLNLLKK